MATAPSVQYTKNPEPVGFHAYPPRYDQAMGQGHHTPYAPQPPYAPHNGK
jgi:hypothetical protein